MARYEGMLAETVRIQGHNGDEIDAYLARPLGPGPFGSVVLIHHMPGWDAASKEMARKLAANGFATISPDIHYRVREKVGFGASHEEVSGAVREGGMIPDAQCIGDVEASMQYLRSLPYTNGKVGVIGFCSGGRQVYLVACNIPSLDAAVDCWGGGVTSRDSEAATDSMPVAPIEMTANMNCALLGIFGNEDARPSPEEVDLTELVLKQHNKNFEFHRYDDAGHGFFAVDRPSYRQAAATDAWDKVIDFYNTYLGTGSGAASEATLEAVPADDN